MTEKFNPKKYRGKQKVYIAVPFAPRVSRLWAWDDKNQEYRAPNEQKCYMARRWEKTDDRKKRTYQFFDSLEDARLWQVEADKVPVPVKKDGASSKTELESFKVKNNVTEYLPAEFTVKLARL